AGELGRAALEAAEAAPAAAPREEASTRSLPVAPAPAPAVRPAPPSAVRAAPTRRLSVPPARRNRIAALAALGVGALFLIPAIADYRSQFAKLASPPSYRLSGLRMSPRPGAVTVTGRYAISSDTGTTTGRITFGLVERGGRLLIRRLLITPD